MKHYKSEECLHNPEYSSLRRYTKVLNQHFLYQTSSLSDGDLLTCSSQTQVSALATALIVFFLPLRIRMKKYKYDLKRRLNYFSSDFLQIDDFQYSRYEAIQMRAEEIMKQDKLMDERMMTRLRSKRQYRENLQESK